LCREAGIPVIASGGVSSAQDVRAIWERRASGIEGVILGRSLYDKKIDFAELKKQMLAW
jgi:phosphoribosylformimino-5-aminoimidazole carboxamide ribotide isomerase